MLENANEAACVLKPWEEGIWNIKNFCLMCKSLQMRQPWDISTSSWRGKKNFKATCVEIPKRILELIEFQSVSLRTFSTNTGLGAEQYVHGGPFFQGLRDLRVPYPSQEKHRLGKMITSKGLLSIICNFISGKRACTKSQGPSCTDIFPGRVP